MIARGLRVSVKYPDNLFRVRNATNRLAGSYRTRSDGEIHKEDALCGHVRVDDGFDVPVGNLKVKSLFRFDLDGLVCDNFIAGITPLRCNQSGTEHQHP